MSNEQRLFRTQILDYPEFETYYAFDERTGQESIEWTCPVGWVASEEYVERFRTNKFFEPDTSKIYRSRSSARERAELLNSMGYVAIVQRSAPVEWPERGEKSVDDYANVAKALQIVKRHGFVVNP